MAKHCTKLSLIGKSQPIMAAFVKKNLNVLFKELSLYSSQLTQLYRAGSQGMDLESPRVLDRLATHASNLGMKLSALPLQIAIQDVEREVRQTAQRLVPIVETGSLNVDPVQLATCVFQAKVRHDDYRGLSYNNLLRALSRCFSSGRERAFGGYTSPFQHFQEVDSSCQIDELASGVAAKIIEACGLDPWTCTHKMLDDLDPCVICVTCADIAKAQDKRKDFAPVITWSCAVSLPLFAFQE